DVHRGWGVHRATEPVVLSRIRPAQPQWRTEPCGTFAALPTRTTRILHRMVRRRSLFPRSTVGHRPVDGWSFVSAGPLPGGVRSVRCRSLAPVLACVRADEDILVDHAIHPPP